MASASELKKLTEDGKQAFAAGQYDSAVSMFGSAADGYASLDDKLNAADSMCYQAEKMLADFGSKITAELRGRIEAALRRIDEGRYGICLACGGALGLQRLRGRMLGGCQEPCPRGPGRY